MRNRNTRDNYQRDIQQFIAFAGIGSTEQLREVTRPHVLAWRDHLQGQGLANDTIRRKLAALSSLYAYLCDCHAVLHNPVLGVRRPPSMNRDGATPALGDDQALRLLEAPPAGTLKGKRDRAMLAVLLYHGIRREELCKLRVGDIQSRQGVWHLRIEGKREKIRYIPLAIAAQRLITAYLAEAKHGHETDGPLFRPVKNNTTKTLAKPLHKASVWDMVRFYTRQTGIAGTAPHLGVHALRATAATNALEHGADIAKVQEWLGHADISTTRLYDKRGTPSVGVKRQWCSHRGKVDNCQVGVFMGYVSRHDHALLDFRLSLPQDWARDEQRREECHVPPEVRYHTRHDQCLEMLDEWGEQVPHGWVTGDDELGRHTRFRDALRVRGERYVLGVPCTTAVRDLEAPWPAYQGRGRPPKPSWQSVTVWRHALAPDAWAHLTVRDGEKGPVAIEMVKRRVQTRIERKRTGPAEWLVVTRCPHADTGTLEGQASPDARDQDARYCYRYYLTPTCVAHRELTEPLLGELARVIKAGACIEGSFKRGKGEAGMDEYQARTWEGWHHHMALMLIAVWFLIEETRRGRQWTPALTLPQVRYGLSVLLMEVFCTLSIPSTCRHV